MLTSQEERMRELRLVSLTLQTPESTLSTLWNPYMFNCRTKHAMLECL